MIELFLKGLITGFIVGMPASPGGILCLKHNLLHKNKKGFFAGFGVATADLVFAIIALLGITVISEFIFKERKIIYLLGGLIFLYIGIKDLFFYAKTKKKNVGFKKGTVASYLFGFLVTLANPLTIFAFLVVYSLMGVGSISYSPILSLIVIAGSFAGSLTLWTVINMAILKRKHKITDRFSRRVHRISGALLSIFGIGLLLQFAGII